MVLLRDTLSTWLGGYLGFASQNDGSLSYHGQSGAFAASSVVTPSTVALKNGSYTGVHNSAYNQDFFLGIPYAQKPDRFRQALHLDSTWEGTHEAAAYPPHCVGYGFDQVGNEVSEDCLYLNVVRPAGIDSTAELPVAVWIHGGGLRMGGSGDKRYNLTFIVENSVEQGTPIIGVSINYRLSAFGFLAGQQVRDAGLANIGFRDQRLALYWIQENIAAFGGAPEKVVIWGESSGAESVSAQTLAYNGRNDGLFRGVVGESGFGGYIARFPGNLNATGKQQENYDQLVRRTSCKEVADTDTDTLDCLRRLPFAEIDKALSTGNGSFFPVLDGDFIADYPHNQLRDGHFVRVPVLIGCNSDEGSDMGGHVGPDGKGVNTDDDFRAAIVHKFGLDGSTLAKSEAASTPEKAGKLVDELVHLYPNIQAIGIPGLDKFPAITLGDDLAESVGLQYRRSAAIFGDNWMHYTRRRASLAWSAHDVPSWSYRFDVVVNGVPAQYGSGHFVEVAFVFDNIQGLGYDENPFENSPASFAQLAKTMSKAWINFFVDLDPNGKSAAGRSNSSSSLSWPIYNATTGGGAGHNMVWQAGSSHVEPDTYRAEGISWMIEHGLDVFGV